MARKGRSRPDEVFLSHSSRNHAFATKLAGTMRDHGVPVWYSKSNIVGAQQWHDEIGRALERCDWFVVILSPSSVKSRWVKHELVYALNDSRYESHIVPVVAITLLPLNWQARCATTGYRCGTARATLSGHNSGTTKLGGPWSVAIGSWLSCRLLPSNHCGAPDRRNAMVSPEFDYAPPRQRPWSTRQAHH